MIALFIAMLLIVFLVSYFKLYLFLFPKNRLPILMYHRIEPETTDDLTVSLEQIEKQFKFLSEQNFTAVFFSEINEAKSKKIILTFDDGYFNNYQYLPELLKKYNLKATIFIATSFVESGYENYKIMTYDQIRSLDQRYFEIGIHSHAHQNFRTISVSEIEQDLCINIEKLHKNGVQFSNVLAYPYGKYPKKTSDKNQLFSALQKLKIDFAVRIGNKINFFSGKSSYQLCRIDVKGTDTLLKFKLKLIFGKLKVF